jgi:hypothetical protein
MCFFTIRTRIINERMLLLRIGNNLLKRNCMTNVRIYLYNHNFCARGGGKMYNVEEANLLSIVKNV